jgi:SAM-dependent methyltransferase
MACRLSVGCYDGVLLGTLGPKYRKFGVEASAAAAREAQRRGIDIVAPRIRDLAAVDHHFDVVCAVDVIEHVADPRAFVQMLVQRLAPGGTLIISTGSIDTPAWRFAGGGYWYCSYPEHISFISPAWATSVARELGL